MSSVDSSMAVYAPVVEQRLMLPDRKGLLSCSSSSSSLQGVVVGEDRSQSSNGIESAPATCSSPMTIDGKSVLPPAFATKEVGGWQFDDDLVTPCQGLLHKYADFPTIGPSDSLRVDEHPQLREIADANFKALKAADTSSTGSEHTWNPDQLNHITSPSVSYDTLEHTASSLTSYAPLPAPSLSGNKKTQYKKTKLCPWHREGPSQISRRQNCVRS
eukprot:Protomagalhaensia_sp_Gyna_25__3698@NODE_331_length_3848_cov_15_007614_g258_i0_p3_GENE_NODE_331_length_3848_cov_15_007614_g258_i0NODE_331_length_3848_cov_15_007614_g258_i0_p3_ORF_typecomplete_len216_score25_18_NODE_331_length_3848_cov_15_007614_g258_i021152762